jgi:hypothetical protein
MPLPKWELATSSSAVCTHCGAANTASVFPAMLAPPPAPAKPETALDGEAACFDHPGKRAVAACSQCGRFVCQLCSVEFGAEVWCPSCVATGSGRAKAANPDTSRTLYDSIAFTLPLGSLVIWPLTAIAAPAAVLFSLAKWRQPLSLVRRSRWRFMAAILLGLGECAGWIWGIAYFLESLPPLRK